MKIKLINGLLIVDIFTILLILAITFIPSNIIRIILGIPFILFFPGYVLVSALFIYKERDNIELIALSAGLSIAIVALIGLVLNYTTWGVSLLPVLYFISIWILLLSIVAIIRRFVAYGSRSLIMDFKINIPGWEGSVMSKSLTFALIAVIIASIGSLGYVSAAARSSEKYSEFYILGLHGKAQDYPTDLILQGGLVSEVNYNTVTVNPPDGRCSITLGIVNHEQKQVTYSVVMKINDQQINMYINEKDTSQIDIINFNPDEKWENEIGFIPQNTGDNQKVELFLKKDNSNTIEQSVHFWVNVSASP